MPDDGGMWGGRQLARTARHVRESEARVTRQEAIVAQLERGRDREAAALAREVLETFQEVLALFRVNLRRERARAGPNLRHQPP